MGWREFFTALFRGLEALLAAIQKKRAADMRGRIADDPCGVLLDQLNPSHSDAPRSAKSAKTDTGRDARRLD